MKISNRHIAQAVLIDIQSGKDTSAVVASLAAYLVAERRSKDAEAVGRELERLLGANGQVELNVTTAHGLSAELKETVTKMFSEGSSKVIINEQQDPAVLGGVLVESGEKRLDLTVRRQIQRLKGVRV